MSGSKAIALQLFFESNNAVSIDQCRNKERPLFYSFVDEWCRLGTDNTNNGVSVSHSIECCSSTDHMSKFCKFAFIGDMLALQQ